MRYRVAVVKRIDSEGHESSLEPSLDVDTLVPDGVVADKVFVEHLESDAEHVQETLDEDDAFLGSATTEIWEYEVVDEREPNSSKPCGARGVSSNLNPSKPI